MILQGRELITLLNGDSLELLKEMQDDYVDYVFTSPPYNIGRNRSTLSNQKAKYDDFDDKNPKYFDWCTQIIDECLRVSSKHVFWVVQANYYNKKDIYKLIGHYADVLIQNFIWTKSHYVPASEHYAISNAVEYVLAFSNEKRIKGNEINNLNHIHTTERPPRFKNHAAIMNQEVADHFIGNYTKKGEVVLDPFVGSGTTGISCIKLKRNFVGIDISQGYIDFARERINEHI